MLTIRESLREGRGRIEATGSDEAGLEAEILMIHALGIDRARLYQVLGEELTPEQTHAFQEMLARRLKHEPTAYLVGRREFFGLEFEVTPSALIPRPETETLVELALAFVRQRPGRQAATIVDVGTGAGTIAIPLARELPAATMIAVDSSPDVLELARRNAARHGVADRIEFREGDLLGPVSGQVDAVLANLPYVTTEQWDAMPPEIKDWEPRSALDGGRDGLNVIRRLLEQTAAPGKLRAGGALLCEIGDWQGDAVRGLAEAAFPGARVVVHKDLAGRDRVVAVYL